MHRSRPSQTCWTGDKQWLWWPCKTWELLSFQELHTDPCNRGRALSWCNMRWWWRINNTIGLRISSGCLSIQNAINKLHRYVLSTTYAWPHYSPIFVRRSPFVYIGKSLRSLSSAHEKWQQKPNRCVFVLIMPPLVHILTFLLQKGETNIFGHSQRKASLLIKFWAFAGDGQQLPVAFSPEAAVIGEGLEAASTFHAGPAVKLIARTPQNRKSGEISQSMQGQWHFFTTVHFKNIWSCCFWFSTKQFVQVLERYLALKTRSPLYKPIRVKYSKCLPLLTVASFCLAC